MPKSERGNVEMKILQEDEPLQSPPPEFTKGKDMQRSESFDVHSETAEQELRRRKTEAVKRAKQAGQDSGDPFTMHAQRMANLTRSISKLKNIDESQRSPLEAESLDLVEVLKMRKQNAYVNIGEMMEDLKIQVEFQRQMAQFVVFLLFLMLVLLRAALRKEIPAIASEYWEVNNGIRTRMYDAHISVNDPKTFDQITDPSDLAVWAKGPLLSTLFTENEDLIKKKEFLVGPSERRISPVLIRQHRVSKKDSVCAKFKFLNTSIACSPAYLKSTRGEAPFGGNHTNTKNRFTWTPEGGGNVLIPDGTGRVLTDGGSSVPIKLLDETGFSFFSTYDPSGYLVVLPNNKNKSEVGVFLDDLFKDGYVDEDTRLVSFSFGSYTNGKVPKVTWSIFTAEMRERQRVQTKVRIVSYEWAAKSSTSAQGMLKWIILFFLLFLIAKVCFEMRAKVVYARTQVEDLIRYRDRSNAEKQWVALRMAFFDPWTLLEIFTMVAMLMKVYFEARIDAELGDLMKTPYDMDRPIGDYENWTRNAKFCFIASGGSTCLLLVVLFKFVKLNRRLSVVWATLAHGVVDMLTIVMVLVILTLAFAVAFVSVFGHDMHMFSNLIDAFVALWRLGLGYEWEWREMDQTSMLHIPFSLTWIFIVLIVVVNLLIAVVTQAFDQVKSENSKSKALSKKSMFTYARKGLASLFRKFVRAMRQRGDPQRSDFSRAIATDSKRIMAVCIKLQAELCEPLTDEEVKLYSKNGKVVHLVHADIFALHLRELNFNKKRIRRYVLLYRFRPDLCIAEAEDEMTTPQQRLEDRLEAIETLLLSVAGGINETLDRIPGGARAQKHAKKAEDLFDSIDKNGDGRLPRDELLAGLMKHGLKEYEIDELIKNMDEDKDGEISKAEWNTAWSRSALDSFSA